MFRKWRNRLHERLGPGNVRIPHKIRKRKRKSAIDFEEGFTLISLTSSTTYKYKSACQQRTEIQMSFPIFFQNLFSNKASISFSCLCLLITSCLSRFLCYGFQDLLVILKLWKHSVILWHCNRITEWDSWSLIIRRERLYIDYMKKV